MTESSAWKTCMYNFHNIIMYIILYIIIMLKFIGGDILRYYVLIGGGRSLSILSISNGVTTIIIIIVNSAVEIKPYGRWELHMDNNMKTELTLYDNVILNCTTHTHIRWLTNEASKSVNFKTDRITETRVVQYIIYIYSIPL